MRRAILTLAFVASACGPRPTQILVHVDAEDGVRDATRSLWIRVWGRDPDQPAFEESNLQFETAPTSTPEIGWPWVVDLRPREGDADRVWRIEASGYAGGASPDGPSLPPTGEFIAVARASASYEPGEIRHVYLLLRDTCIGVSCEDPNSTCAAAGRCEAIGDPVFFDPDAGAPVGMDAGPRIDAGDRRDAGQDREDSGPVCAPVAEACNGLDDDCDEAVDEDFDLELDARHCGACDASCDGAHGAGSCSGGTCRWTCEPGFHDCEPAPGCETPDSAMNCGACGMECGGGTPNCDTTPLSPTCTAGCTAGSALCGTACVNTQTNASHCGACDAACASRPGASGACSGGSCAYTCNANRGDCDGDLGAPQGSASNGCETDLTQATSCGECGTGCSVRDPRCASPLCASGRCAESHRPNGSSCSLGACAGRCDAGLCSGSCPMDAGGGTPEAGPRDAGHDAGIPEAGSEAGCGGGCASCCAGVCCGDGEFCDGGVCTLDPCGGCGAGDECCSAELICCPTGTGCACADAGVDCGGSCTPGQMCSGGTCFDDTSCGGVCGGVGVCCGGTCCDSSFCSGDEISGWTCEDPGDGGIAGCTGDICGGGCCDLTQICCGDTVCCPTAEGCGSARCEPPI